MATGSPTTTKPTSPLKMRLEQVAQQAEETSTRTRTTSSSDDHRHRRTEKEEDEELLSVAAKTNTQSGKVTR